MNNNSFSLDERAAAMLFNMNSAQLLTETTTKRGAEADDAAGINRPAKLTRTEDMNEGVRTLPSPMPRKPAIVAEEAEKKPYPWFHYKDFSQEPDADPLTPLTPPGRVPTFGAYNRSSSF